MAPIHHDRRPAFYPRAIDDLGKEKAGGRQGG
jgi:hypothetical protein